MAASHTLGGARAFLLLASDGRASLVSFSLGMGRPDIQSIVIHYASGHAVSIFGEFIFCDVLDSH